jgi:hypothetical protein
LSWEQNCRGTGKWSFWASWWVMWWTVFCLYSRVLRFIQLNDQDFDLALSHIFIPFFWPFLSGFDQ